METNAASQPATNVEPYIRADGTRIWSVTRVERRLPPEAFDRRPGRLP
jgi:hypothetical protein